jgi:exodeoxyribonuclease VII small subunit
MLSLDMTENAIKSMTFEDALTELEGIVRNLETGQTKLDDSISSYERGVALKKHCEKRLNDARLKIEKISLDTDGKPTGLEEFDPE